MPVVWSAANPMEAHLCRQFLEDMGIAARVDGEILWQARGDLPPNDSTNPTVLVSERDFVKARDAVLKFQEDRDQETLAESWTCSRCEETNPGSFDSCWNCETPAPESVCEEKP